VTSAAYDDIAAGTARTVPSGRAQNTMHVVDMTLFFAPHSGGVKRYLLAKRHFLRSQPRVRHTLLVPGAATTSCESGLIELASARIPFGGGYRLPLRMRRWAATLEALRPDVIEVADPYHLSWRWRSRNRTSRVCSTIASDRSPVARPASTFVACIADSTRCSRRAA
jgi:hypothetical protein